MTSIGIGSTRTRHDMATFCISRDGARALDWDSERGIGYLFGLRIAAHGVDLGHPLRRQRCLTRL
jgi:hypothetical protein